MRRSPLTAIVVVAVATLRGCTEGILNPQGPIASAERQVLFNSLAIMLAIVIPTIVAVLATGFWFRASNSRAKHLPDFNHSGLGACVVDPGDDSAPGWRRRLTWRA